MQMAKAVTTLALLLLASRTVPAQENAVPERSADQEKSPVAILNWNEKPDVQKWLRENEPSLNRGDGCNLTSSWMNEESPKSPSGSVYEIASFVITPGDEEMTRIIRDAQPGVDVRVGVRYIAGGPGGSYLLQIALAFEGEPDGIFDEISRAEAETLRYANWKWLTAVKPVRVGNLRYRFSLRCENGRTFLSFFRRPVKHTPSKSPKK